MNRKVDAPSIDPSAYEVRQEWYLSKDGTRIPMFIVSKKGVEKNGKNPTLLPVTAGSTLSRRLHSAEAYTSGWNMAVCMRSQTCAAAPSSARIGTARGCSTKKQNVFDDFISAAGIPDRAEVHGQGASMQSAAARTAAC